jgi:CRP/FNR family transcriptional regulator
MKLDAMRAACSKCNLRELCLPMGLTDADLQHIDRLVGARRSLRRGDALFCAGEPFESIFAVRSGFFKTRVSVDDGRERVTGFQMAGELLGLDGISAERHTCDAIALEDSEVCVIGYSRLEEVSRDVAGLQRQFHRVLSREIVREQGVMLLLGGVRAEARLAAFLLNLGERLRSRGFSGSSMVLRMTREEIGSYLGIKLETVSRAFSRFQEESLLEVRQRNVRVVDEAGLRRLAFEAPG